MVADLALPLALPWLLVLAWLLAWLLGLAWRLIRLAADFDMAAHLGLVVCLAWLLPRTLVWLPTEHELLVRSYGDRGAHAHTALATRGLGLYAGRVCTQAFAHMRLFTAS